MTGKFYTPWRRICRALVVVAVGVGAARAGAQEELPSGDVPEPPSATIDGEIPQEVAVSDDEPQVLTRGPLHEAFAAPVAPNPQPGDVVAQRPPDPIEELPPEVKPEGKNVEWIPGYWSWDEQEERYIWISGVWRVVPPGREWVPGYWAQEAEGFRWIAGYWGASAVAPRSRVAEQIFDAARRAEAVVAPPPETLEVGPTSPQPSNGHFWIPGCWIASHDGYRWRPGYWYTYQPNWVWIPDHYVWTPAGCVFVGGYWDYTLQARGMCFAPVYFANTIYRRPHYVYRPHYALQLAHVALHLFVHPHRHHYCYGDFYGATYASYGYRPWFDFHLHRHHHHHYDPLITYYDVHYHRHGIDYVGRLHGWHRYYDHHEDQRPPRTVQKQRVLASQRGLDAVIGQKELARSVDEIRSNQGDRQVRNRVVAIDRDASANQSRERIAVIRDAARQRQIAEQEAAQRSEAAGAPTSRRIIVRDEPAVRQRITAGGQDAISDAHRRAVERSRQLAREPKVRPSEEPGGVRNPADLTESRRVIVRGQQPEIGAERAVDAISKQRERVLRLDPIDPRSARNRAVERLQSRSPSSIEQNQQSYESARRAQEAIILRQQSRERLEGRVPSQNGRGSVLTLPPQQGPIRNPIVVPQRERSRVAPQQAPPQTRPRVIAPRQIERPKVSAPRITPQSAPRPQPQPRVVAPPRTQAQPAPRPAPSAGKSTIIQPSGKSRLWRPQPQQPAAVAPAASPASKSRVRKRK